MTDLLRIKKEISTARRELRAYALKDDATAEEIATRNGAIETLEARADVLRLAEEAKNGPGRFDDSEGREYRALRGRAKVSEYLGAALEMRAVTGAAAEFNSAVKVGAGRFPLRLLAPEREVRATTDAEAQANQRNWLDRLFAKASAMRVGVTMKSVPDGVAALPLTTAGATGEQQDRSETTSDAAWTVSVVEAKPKRGSVRAVFNIEDAARLPQLEDALRRDLSMALMDSIDKAVFLGDSGPSTAAYDVTGLNTASSVVERTISQTNKVKGPETLTEFAALIDGIHAEGFGSLGIVAAVGAWRLWESTIINSAADNMTLAAFLRSAGLSWMARGDIETATAADDWAAFVGRMRGNDGAACAAVWESANFIRDMYSGAASGEVALNMTYLWDFQVVRATNFARIKFSA